MISLRTQIRIVEDTVMTVVKYMGAPKKDILLDIFQRNCLLFFFWIVTDHMSKCRLYEKCGSIPFSRAIMKKIKIDILYFPDEG